MTQVATRLLPRRKSSCGGIIPGSCLRLKVRRIPAAAQALAFGGDAPMIANASSTSMRVSATMAKNSRFTKKVILDRFGIAENTLRSWEAKGIISPPERDWRGWRWYTKRHLTQIERHIAKLKRKVERSAKQPKQGGGA